MLRFGDFSVGFWIEISEDFLMIAFVESMPCGDLGLEMFLKRSWVFDVLFMMWYYASFLTILVLVACSALTTVAWFLCVFYALDL